MTEETLFNPCSLKGENPRKARTLLIGEWKSGALSGLIARSADFYGPRAGNGVPNLLVFEPLSKRRKPSWLVNDSVPHSLTSRRMRRGAWSSCPDGLRLGTRPGNLPTTPNPPTGKELIAMAAREFGVAPDHRLLGRFMIRIAGWFNPLVAESYEMLYQSDSPYLFDSGKFAREFGFGGTPTRTAWRATAAAFQLGAAAKA